MASDTADVFSLLYMKIVRASLISIGVWPHTASRGSNTVSRISAICRSILITLAVMQIISTVIYSKKHTDTDLGQAYLNVLMTCVCLQRLFLPFQKKYYIVVNKLILEFHLIHHRHQSNFADKVYKQVNKICSVLSKINCIQVAVAVIMYNLIPLYSNYRAGMFTDHKPLNGTFLHPIDYSLPFDQYNNINSYIILFFYNWFVSYYVAIAICLFDFLVFIIVFHMWGHLNILIHDLQHFYPTRAEYIENLSPIEVTQEYIFIRLKDIMRHHRMIKEFMTLTSEAFSTTLCFYLMFHQLSGCVLLLKCSSLDPPTLVRYGLVAMIVFQQLIETSVIFELIRLKGDILVDAVYGLPWERMNASNRRVVLMFLSNVQASLALKAGGIVPVGVMTMSAILKTSFSYFIMLKTFTK